LSRNRGQIDVCNAGNGSVRFRKLGHKSQVAIESGFSASS
jgi:hypothetical protein